MEKEKSVKTENIDKLLLKGGRVLNPVTDMDETSDMLIIDGVISRISKNISHDGRIVDCSGKVIVPGLLDMHTHLREPGQEAKETIYSGSRAAMAGGFTAVACMPNTDPVIDSRSQIEFIKKMSDDLLIDVYPIGAITKGMSGNELTEMGEMKEAGAVAFSDDGKPIERALILRSALEYAEMNKILIIDHCEDLDLSGNGVMNEGYFSTKLGMESIPSISEDIIVARDLLVAEYTGSHLHIAHVSTKGSVKLIEDAKKRGVKVTAETCPHYLLLTDEAVISFDANTKMKPPLRSDEDKQALIKGLHMGIIDVIATDHAPHLIDEKDIEYDKAAFGIIGLETAVGLILTFFVKKDIITLKHFVELFSVKPREILNLPLIKFAEGEQANLTIIDTERKWKVDKNRFLSKAVNTPFHGWDLQGDTLGVINNNQMFLKIC